MATTPPLPADVLAWNKARHAFANSILVETPLASLAQDLDVPPWPIVSPDETPAAYIYLPYAQALAALGVRGLPPEQLQNLITLLNDTNAFDQPFGDMLDDLAVSADGADDPASPLFKNLAKLGLPEDFPLALSALSAGTLALCQNENIRTLGGFVTFSTRLSQSVIIGGDFRELLNALAQKDETSLAKLLPLRAGYPGLYLPETIALSVRALSAPARTALLQNPATLPAELRNRTAHAVAYFSAAHADMCTAISAGAPPARLVADIPDHTLHALVLELLRPHLPTPPAPPATPAKRSFFRRLFGLK
ncbi:MAG: hypothetical protein NTU80_01685 [Verrucomicrobia bacterium]|nr:hypothetical protein [Verrucomicrobiota bacterium]